MITVFRWRPSPNIYWLVVLQRISRILLNFYSSWVTFSWRISRWLPAIIPHSVACCVFALHHGFLIQGVMLAMSHIISTIEDFVLLVQCSTFLSGCSAHCLYSILFVFLSVDFILLFYKPLSYSIILIILLHPHFYDALLTYISCYYKRNMYRIYATRTLLQNIF